MRHVSALLVIAGLALSTLSPAYAKQKRPKSTNANVQHAMKKTKKIRPAKYKPYKAPKRSKKAARAKYGVV
jgi:hypothetical protein